MFHIGDKVVYPMHGAGTIESIEEKEMFGDKSEYYIIKMPMNDMKLMVPTKTATNVGVREVSDGSIANEVLKILERPKQAYVHENNWSKRYRANVDKIKSGDILELADVVRDLSHRHMERGLSTGEKKMLTSAREILISELVLAQDLDHNLVGEEIEEKIKMSFDLGSTSEVNEEL